MKKSYLTLLAIVFAGYFLISNNAGVATVQNKDRTGSPVGSTVLCNNCHSGGTFTTNIALRMLNDSNNVVTTYTPGQHYTYEVEVTSTGTTTASAYGFQTVGLLASTNAQAGTLVALSTNTKTKVLSGRTYAEHTGRSNPGLFRMTWTAPAAGSGSVKFYAAGLGCNSNSSTSGDKYVKATAMTLTENVSLGIAGNNEKIPFSIYPQPVSTGQLNIRGDYDGYTKLVIADLSGRFIRSENCIFVSHAAMSIDVQDLHSGTYIVVLLNEAGRQIYSSTFIKQ
jgi:hypothetical protein